MDGLLLETPWWTGLAGWIGRSKVDWAFLMSGLGSKKDRWGML